MNVGKRVRQNFSFLYKLCSTKSPKQRCDDVQRAKLNQLLSIMDVCANIMWKNFKLSKRRSMSLNRYNKAMKRLKRAKSRPEILKAIQYGEGIHHGRGFLPTLLLPVLIELAASATRKFLFKK